MATSRSIPIDPYTFVLEDRSLGIHNARYTVQILYDTIASLSPSFDVSKRPR